MKPYFQRGNITIFCGDCRLLLPELLQNAGQSALNSVVPQPPPSHKVLADVKNQWCIVSDPPYGIGYVHGAINIANATKFANVPVIGDDTPFDPSWLLQFPCILWGANHYKQRLPDGGRFLVWDKRCQVVPQRDQSDCEMAWCSSSGPERMFYHVWDGFLKDSERGQPRQHPTQKPVALMKWCLSFFPKAQTVIDPYMGSGTTLVACKEMGLSCTGIEINEAYCAIAARRLEQEVFDFAGA